MKNIMLLLIFSLTLNAQQPEKIIAKIGNISISENEFKYRYELVPRFNSANSYGITEKKNFLYGLITEKLLSLGAQEIKIDTLEKIRNTIKSYEKMFVRDALYRKEIIKKSAQYAENLLSFYIEHPNTILTKYITYNDSSLIYNLWGMLNKGVPFDSVYESLSKYEKDTLTISAGQLDDAHEQMLFSLLEKSISKPLKIIDGWYIFYIEQANSPVAMKTGSWETDYKRIEKASKEKAEYSFYKEYVSAFFKNKQIEANGFLLKALADKITGLFAEKKFNVKPGEKIFLDITDLQRIEKAFTPDSLEQIFVKLSGRIILFKEYLDWYRSESFFSVKSDANSILGLLNVKTRKFIEEELFYDEGIRQGLDKDSAVLSDITMWKDSYLAQLMSSSFQDSIKILDAIVNEYKQSLNEDSTLSILVSIVEVLTDNLEIVELILNELKAGTDIHELASRYTIRNEFRQSKGESGLFSYDLYGDIGRIAAEMNVGDVYGPLKVPEGYSVFKLIDKRAKTTPLSAVPISELTNQLQQKEMRERLNKYVASLADKYKIQIDEGALESIRTTKITSLVFRYLGFGGKITAVPFNSSDIEWSKTYKDKDNL